MIGKTATLTNTNREVTIVGQIRWGYESNPANPIIRYYWTTSGRYDDDGKRIDTLRKAKDVILLK